MIKSKKTNLTMVLSVMALLVCLLFAIINVTGAWFTDASGSNKTINAIIKTAETNLNVYQEDSSGTQTLLSKSLPTGYTQLEYIATTGTQYIDTGFRPTPSTTKYETSISFDDTSGTRGVFGARISSPDANAVNVFCIGGSARLDWADSSWLTSYSVSVNTKYYFECYKNSVTVNGTAHTGTTEKSTTQLTSNFYIGNFSLSGGSAYTSGMIGKIYYSRLYDNGTLVRNFVPAKNSSGTIGMYDTVGNKFYANAGTGTFTAGSAALSGASISLAYDSSNTTNNKVMFGTAKTLKLLLKNEDLGKSFGIRYKVEFFVATPAGKKALSATIAGMTAPTSSTNGFKLNSDGWYYYQNNAGSNVVFEPATSSAATSRYLMTSFTIKADSTTTALLGGNAIYMQISVESVAIS